MCIKTGDLVTWPQGDSDIPGLVIDVKPALGCKNITMSMNPTGMRVLAMLPELQNNPEWFHECELVALP